MSDTNSELKSKLRWAKKSKSQTNGTGTIAEDSTQSDGGVLEKRKNINHLNHLSMYQKNSKVFDSQYPNANGVPKWSNYSQSTIVSNGIHNLKNDMNCTTDSWKESNSVDKIQLTLLSYMNSLTGKLIPLINLHEIANPFLQIPTEVCRLANNINLNVAEILCRKRTETAVITWMVNKLNQSNNRLT